MGSDVFAYFAQDSDLSAQLRPARGPGRGRRRGPGRRRRRDGHGPAGRRHQDPRGRGRRSCGPTSGRSTSSTRQPAGTWRSERARRRRTRSRRAVGTANCVRRGAPALAGWLGEPRFARSPRSAGPQPGGPRGCRDCRGRAARGRRLGPVDLGLPGAVTAGRRADLEPRAGLAGCPGRRRDTAATPGCLAVSAGLVSVGSSSARSRRRFAASSRSSGPAGGALRPRRSATAVREPPATRRRCQHVPSGGRRQQDHQHQSRPDGARLSCRSPACDEASHAAPRQQEEHGPRPAAVRAAGGTARCCTSFTSGPGGTPTATATATCAASSSRLDHLSWLGVDGIWLSPDDAVARRGLGLRRQRLPRRPSRARHAGGPRRADRRGRRAGHAGAARPGAQPHQLGASLVHRRRVRRATPRTATTTCGPTRRRAAGRRTTGWTPPGARPGRWHEPTGQYYLHNFLAEPARPELVARRRCTRSSSRSCEFWFDRGVAGFRIDVAHGLYKDALLRDNPPAAEGDDPLGGRFGLRQVYSMNRPEVHGVFRRLAGDRRRATTRRGCCSARPGCGDWTRWPRSTATTTSCSWRSTSRSCSRPSARRAGRVVGERWRRCPPAPARSGRPPTTTLAGSRPAGAAATTREVRLALLVLATLPGTLVLYYGDEIGMTRRRRCRRNCAGTNDARRRRPARQPRPRPDPDAVGWLAPRPGSPRPPGPGCRPATPPPAMWPPSAPTPSSTLSLCRDLLALRRAEQAAGIAPYQELAVSGALRYQGGARGGQPVRRAGDLAGAVGGDPGQHGRPGRPAPLGRPAGRSRSGPGRARHPPGLGPG